MTVSYNNVYSTPEHYGLTIIGEVEWSDGCYQFDTTVVWRDAAGRLFWASDSGCSCPAPFEYFNGRDDLVTGTPAELGAVLNKLLAEMKKSGYRMTEFSRCEAEVADLMLKVIS